MTRDICGSHASSFATSPFRRKQATPRNTLSLQRRRPGRQECQSALYSSQEPCKSTLSTPYNFSALWAPGQAFRMRPHSYHPLTLQHARSMATKEVVAHTYGAPLPCDKGPVYTTQIYFKQQTAICAVHLLAPPDLYSAAPPRRTARQKPDSKLFSSS